MMVPHIHPVALGHITVARPPQTISGLHQTLEPVIAAKRVAAIGDEGEHPVKRLARQLGIGRRSDDFLIQPIRLEGVAAGAAHHMLGEHIERSGFQRIAIKRARQDGFSGASAFKMLEPIGGDQHGAACRIQPVIGATQPLQKA